MGRTYSFSATIVPESYFAHPECVIEISVLKKGCGYVT